MSKSKGNVLDPLDLCNIYGTDAVRFTLAAMAAQGRDIKLAEGRIAGYRNFITKIWNAARFSQMNGCVLDSAFDPRKVRGTLNKWIVAKTAEAARTISAAIEAYRFNDAANGLYQYTWGTFCDWYLEFTKPVFQGDDEALKAETRAATAWALDHILILGQPIIPFVTHELWDRLAEAAGQERACRLIEAQWPKLDDVVATEAQAEIDWVVDMVTAIRSVRSEMNVPAGAQIPAVLRGASAVTKSRLTTHAGLIAANARLSKIEAGEGDVANAAQVVVGEAVVLLPLAGIIDFAKERDRLKKEIAKLEKNIEGTVRKLSNEAFVAKAPPEVVQENRDRIAADEAEKNKLEEALSRING
jgi:valyl-tRNA synthetase